jgi:hypothetical protein
MMFSWMKNKMETKEDLTKFTYGLRMDFSAYVDPQAKGLRRETPRVMTINQMKETRARILDYVITTYGGTITSDEIRVVGLGNDDVDFWINNQETLSRVKTDLGAIVDDVTKRPSMEPIFHEREINWNG